MAPRRGARREARLPLPPLAPLAQRRAALGRLVGGLEPIREAGLGSLVRRRREQQQLLEGEGVVGGPEGERGRGGGLPGRGRRDQVEGQAQGPVGVDARVNDPREARDDGLGPRPVRERRRVHGFFLNVGIESEVSSE